MYYTHLKTTSPLPVVDVDAKFIVQDHLHDPVEVGMYVVAISIIRRNGVEVYQSKHYRKNVCMQKNNVIDISYADLNTAIGFQTIFFHREKV